MTKIITISVDLGGNIEDIIMDGVSELSSEAEQKLDEAISYAKKVQKVKLERQEAAKRKKQAAAETAKLMEDVFNKIDQSGDEGVPLSEIESLIEGHIASMSAFSLKMRKYLENSGMKLHKFTRNRIPRYKIIHGEL